MTPGILSAWYGGTGSGYPTGFPFNPSKKSLVKIATEMPSLVFKLAFLSELKQP